MYTVPDLDKVTAVAEALGFHLGSEEAALYRTQLVEQLNVLDRFVQARIEEESPPQVFASRAPGYRPSAEEDPFNAWLWKCKIHGAEDGVLAGKTVSYKDHVAVAGIPLTFGSFAMEGFIPDFDATIVTRVLQAGGLIIGKNTLDGFAGGFGFGGDFGDYGRPKNPHSDGHVTGKSSSGSGAAVAAGEVDISFGGDQNGSIRIPAAWCGTVGLKPTFGLVSHFGVGFGADQSIDHTGPMTRTVEDAAAALQAVAGYDGLDPRQARDVPERLDVLSTLAEGIAGLRIGVLQEGFHEADPGVRNVVLAAVDHLAKTGAVISTVSIPEHLMVETAAGALGFEGALAIFDAALYGMFTKTYYPSNVIAAVNKMWAAQADLLEPWRKLSLLVAEFSRRNFHGRVYAKAQNVRSKFVAAYDTALTDVDVLVMPTCNTTAPEHDPPSGYIEKLQKELTLMANKAVRNTRPFSYTGHPALAMPCGKSDRLPVSMQLVGRFFDDPVLLRVAYAFQHSVDWDSVIRVGV